MADQDRSATPDPHSKAASARDARIDDRFRDLDASLAKAKAGQDVSDTPAKGLVADGAAYSRAAKMAAEFVGGTLAGLGLGWIVDRLTGWSPVGLIVGLFLGFVTGFWNIYKAALASGDVAVSPPAGDQGGKKRD